ncbi:hypothetical protein CEP51_015367 [Fusarium floridanum]|uniref:Uncharacterized protein n=1 Tax=Fusarium floridanum TaxID=1325733 RepID=A0A428PBI4_9HYPO|nr:hypothetical protein CEP51_015367 [Fusarium floridanum]
MLSILFLPSSSLESHTTYANAINPTQELQGVDLTCSDNRPLTPEVVVGAERQETEATSEIKGIIETPARSVITCTYPDLPIDRASII